MPKRRHMDIRARESEKEGEQIVTRGGGEGKAGDMTAWWPIKKRRPCITREESAGEKTTHVTPKQPRTAQQTTRTMAREENLVSECEQGMVWRTRNTTQTHVPREERPQGFKRMPEDNELGMEVMRTAANLKGVTMGDIRGMRKAADVARASSDLERKREYRERLERMATDTG